MLRDAKASEDDINTSTRFVPRAAASEMDPPEVVATHWLPILQEQGRIAECHPNKFTAAVDLVPVYTPDSLWKHLPAALSAFANTNPPQSRHR